MRWALVAVAALGCDGHLTAEGDTYRYVVKQVVFPTTNTEATDFTLSLVATGAELNAFGTAAIGLPLTRTTESAITQGVARTDVALQTRSFFETVSAGVTITASGEAGGGQMLGAIDRGVFSSELGAGSIQISFDGNFAVTLPLARARTQLAQISATGIGTGVLAGALPESYMQTQFVDDFMAGVNALIGVDCSLNTTCTCAPSSPGGIYVIRFDTNRNCEVDRAELDANAQFRAMVNDGLNIDGVDHVTIGVRITALVEPD